LVRIALPGGAPTGGVQPLAQLACDFSPLRDTEILKTLKNLVAINGKTAAEFWKEFGVRK
jgi:hypothetical protein